jgi:hypothetical protein
MSKKKGLEVPHGVKRTAVIVVLLFILLLLSKDWGKKKEPVKEVPSLVAVDKTAAESKGHYGKEKAEKRGIPGKSNPDGSVTFEVSLRDLTLEGVK